MMALVSGETEQALQLFQDALALFTEEHDTWKMTRTLYGIGVCYSSTGKYEQAIHIFKQAIAICDDTSDMRSLGVLLFQLANCLRAMREYQVANQVAQQSLAVNRAADYKYGLASSLEVLGEMAWNMGDFAAAQHHAAESVALWQELGLTRAQDYSLSILGNAAYGLGDYQQARNYFHTILRSHLQAGTLNASWFVGYAAYGLALVFAKEGQTAQAVELLYHMLHHPSIWRETKDQALALLAELMPGMPIHSEPPARPLDIVIAEVLRES
jgi:tetratricopeptide (TPR) repeat protein